LALAVLATTSLRAQRPPVAGRTAGVSTGHPLTSAAALDQEVLDCRDFHFGCPSI
jgi:hypothetical protein